MTCIEIFWVLIGPLAAWGGWHIGKHWGPGTGILAAIVAGLGPYALSYGLLIFLEYRKRRRAGGTPRIRDIWDEL